MKKIENRSVINNGTIVGNVNTGNLKSTTPPDNKKGSSIVIWSSIIAGISTIIAAVIKV
jgi:hypothetical protein